MGKIKSYLVFGASAGALLLLIQVIHYKVMIRDMELEVLEATIAIIFLTVGILLSLSVRKIKQHLKINRDEAKKARLSDREMDVLALLVHGHSNQEIADRLFVSLNTIKTHLASIYGKLGVSRRTQAIQKAKELAILSPDRMNSAKSPESMNSK